MSTPLTTNPFPPPPPDKDPFAHVGEFFVREYFSFDEFVRSGKYKYLSEEHDVEPEGLLHCVWRAKKLLNDWKPEVHGTGQAFGFMRSYLGRHTAYALRRMQLAKEQPPTTGTADRIYMLLKHIADLYTDEELQAHAQKEAS